MGDERARKLWKVMNHLAKLQREEEDNMKRKKIEEEEIQYHGPYTDASGQRFFLPQKLVNNRVQGVDYKFSEDLDDDKLMNNLSWLGRGNDIMDLVHQQQVVEGDDEVEDDESSYPPPKKVLRKSSSLVGGGSVMTVDEEFLSE